MSKLLIINPGSTSTKMGVFEDRHKVDEIVIRHKDEELSVFDDVIDQKDFRLDVIKDKLAELHVDIEEFDAIVGRGGQMKPVESGTYEVTEEMIEDMKSGRYGVHASSLGGMLAKEIGDSIGVKSYVVDPVVVDEMDDFARVSGLKGCERFSSFHALNQKSMARRYATEIDRDYESLNLIGCHMGGGISVVAHQRGRVVDVNNSVDGDGPFTPERTGSIPLRGVLHLIFDQGLNADEVIKLMTSQSGLYSYVGTKDAKVVSDKAKSGSKKHRFIYEAMAYQVAKEIASLGAVLKGDVDAIILTGGLAYDDLFVNWIRERVEFIAPVVVYPGEDELQALADGICRILNGEAQVKIY